jgi:hypothetical protein
MPATARISTRKLPLNGRRIVLVQRDRAGLRVERAVGPLDYVSLATAAAITGMVRATVFRLADRGELPVRRVRGTRCRVVRLIDAVRAARSRRIEVDLSRPNVLTMRGLYAREE